MAYLKNNYKLLYEFRDIPRTLRATKTLPASTDVNVTYKNENGEEVNPKDFKLIFEKDSCFYGSTIGSVSDAIKFSMYSGNDLIYGEEVVPPVEKIHVAVESNVDGTICGFRDTEEMELWVDPGTVVTAFIKPDITEHKEWNDAPSTCTINDSSSANVSLDKDDEYICSVIINEDTIMRFNDGSTRTIQVEFSVAKATIPGLVNTNIGIRDFQGTTRTISCGATQTAYIMPEDHYTWKNAPTLADVSGTTVSITSEAVGNIRSFTKTSINADTVVTFLDGEAMLATTPCTITLDKDYSRQNFEVKWGFSFEGMTISTISKTLNEGDIQRVCIEPDGIIEWQTEPNHCLVNSVEQQLIKAEDPQDMFYADIEINTSTINVIFNDGETRIPLPPANLNKKSKKK